MHPFNTMLRNLISLRARQAAQRLKKSLEALSESLTNNNNVPRRQPVRVPIPVRNSNPFQRSTAVSPYIPGRRHLHTNPFNPFLQWGNVLRLLSALKLSPLNPFSPLGRYRAFRQFRFFWPPSGSVSLRSQLMLANSIWHFSAFRGQFVNQLLIQRKAFFFSGLYRASFPQTSSRLFTTYSCGGPMLGFLMQLTSDTIKNLAIGFRTLFNIDSAYLPASEYGENLYHPHKCHTRRRSHRRLAHKSIKSEIRLNQSLLAKHAAATAAIGGSVSDDETITEAIVHGCYVDFALGGDLSIPSMTFLTEEILSEISANLTYITRRINELKQDFKNLSELGELPIRYMERENVIRVYFANCDRDKLELLLKEKNIMGGTIHENKKGAIVAQEATPAAAPTPVVTSSSYITENDLLSSLYNGNSCSGSGRSSDHSSAESSVLFDDDVLSSYGSSRNRQPLSDAEVVRISDVCDTHLPGHIAISDTSGDFHWV